MYNLIYTVPFTSVDGETLTVQILEDGGTGTPTELVGGTPPFVVDVDDEDFLYTPTRFSGATLKLVGSDYLQRLFSTQYQKFKVNLIKSGSIVWTGFITPEVYSQDYDNSLFELEIECISALSTLEYIDYKQEDATVSLLGLINKCITESKGDFRAVYVPSTYTSSLDDITVSTANFIDEDGKAMTLKECLAEVCKFLNWTVTEYDGCIYFIDVDYIKAGKTIYTNILTGTSVTLSSTINLQVIPSKGSSNTLSILGGYNKVNIIASDYEVDSGVLYPELKLNTAESVLYKFEKVKDDTIYKKEYYTSNLELFNYAISGNSYSAYANPFTAANQAAGSVAMRKVSYGKRDAISFYSWDNLVEVKQKSAVVLDSSTPYYLYKDIYDKGEVNNNAFILNYPVIKHKVNDLSRLVFDPDIKLCISFDIYLTTDKDGLEGDFKPSGLTSVPYLYIPMQLKLGNYYYNGSSWVTDSTTIFRCSTNATPDNYVNSWLKTYNYNKPELGVPELNGYIVNFSDIKSGSLELTIYNPAINPYSTPVFNNPIESFFIRNIKISTQRVNSEKSETDKKNDTIYSNTIESGYINQCDDIEFRITSKNESELSFSKAMYNNSLLDKISNTISNTEKKPEKFLIERIVNQYKQPKIKLTKIIKPEVLPYSVNTDNYLSGKKFIFTGGNINYEDNSIECNMIEIN